MKLPAIKSIGTAAVLTASALFLANPAAHADTFTFSAAGATATIITSAGQIEVQLFSTNSNPISDASELSGIVFTLGGSGFSGGTLANATAPDGIVTITGGVATPVVAPVGHWGTSLTGSTVCLETVGTCAAGGKPFDLIIDPPYTNANPSIEQHNPSIATEGDFILNIAGVTVTNGKTLGTQITSATFMFGTGPTSEDGTPGTTPSVPEPSSLLLLGTGILGAAGALRNKMFKA